MFDLPLTVGVLEEVIHDPTITPKEACDRLNDMGFFIVPVKGMSDSKEKEKLPVYPYSSNSHITIHTPVEEFDRVFSDPRVGIALSLQKGCQVLIIDTDKPEEERAFQAWWKEHTDRPVPPPTVVTPGVKDDGDWKHSQGGHRYITYPCEYEFEGSLWRQNVNVNAGDEGSHFNIRLHGSYCILPPTRRTEGQYKATGVIIDGYTDDIGIKLIEYCKKEKKTFTTHRPVKNADNFYDSSTNKYNFTPDMSFEDRLAVWHSRENHHENLMSTGLFVPDSSGCSGSTCQTYKYKSSTQSRSITVHGYDCSVAPYGTATIFSGTLAADLGCSGDVEVKSMWTIIKTLKYANDVKAAIHGEGLHVDQRVSYGSGNWFVQKYGA